MLFNASTKTFCVLNASATHIWERLDEPRTAEELVASLREHFDANGAAAVEDDVLAVLGQLETLQLVHRES